MGALSNLRVLDLSTVLAGPGCARHLGDFGAEVIKIERRNSPDSLRNMGWRDPADGQSMFFKTANRNKLFIELDLRDADDRETFEALVETADVLIENMRPGKLDQLGFTKQRLWELQPKLVIARISAFGQTGPYRDRPGFASLAEAMSGFAALNGQSDGAPTLPPIALTDEVTALAAAFAVMVALHAGVGQEIDVNLLESLLQLMGPLPSLFLTRGEQQPRLGSGLPYSTPRGTYECADGRWVAISTSSDSVAQRVMTLIGLEGDERVETGADRMANREFIEARMVAWVAARPRSEVMEAFVAADAAIADVYDIAELCGDEHVRSRGLFPTVEGFPTLPPVARLSATPAELVSGARAPGADAARIKEWLASRG